MEQKTAHLPISDRLWAWFDDDNNRKRALWGAGLVAVVGLVVGYYLHNQGRKEIEAGNALSQLMTTAIFSGGNQNATPEAYLKIATEHPGTPAAAQAVLLAAGRFFGEGKFADAHTQFQRFTREFSGNPFTAEAALGMAASLEAQGKLDDAARAYKEAADRYPNAVGTPQAKLALGRIQESQGNLDAARANYEDIRRNFPFHSLANEAAFRLEELQKKMPAPKPVANVPSTTVSTPATSAAPGTPAFQPSLTNLPAKPN